MKIDLAGRRACVAGASCLPLEALVDALRQNGCIVFREGVDDVDACPDILVLAKDLQPAADLAAPAGVDLLDRWGDEMMRRGSGRIVMLLGALAAVPVRRFPDASVAAAADLARMRTLAMRLGPAVLVNAVGCGAIADPDGLLVCGDASMLSHVPDGRTGEIADVVHAVLFLCDPMNSYMTGQMLSVDGGWSAGYGRNF